MIVYRIKGLFQQRNFTPSSPKYLETKNPTNVGLDVLLIK